MKTLIIVAWTLVLGTQAVHYYLEGSRPVFILPTIGEDGQGQSFARDDLDLSGSAEEEVPETPTLTSSDSDQEANADEDAGTEFRARARFYPVGESSDSEEQFEEDEAEEAAAELAEIMKKNRPTSHRYKIKSSKSKANATEIPPNFSAIVNKNRKFPPRPAGSQLKADPGKVDRPYFEEEEEDDEAEDGGGSSSSGERGRLLWPFTVSVSKHQDDGDEHKPHFPTDEEHFGYKNHYPSHHHHDGHSSAKGGYQGQYWTGWDTTAHFQGLNEKDIDILHSKGYKKYKKKKKRKIKKLKKKLKMKRILQKILEKKIDKIDERLLDSIY